MSGQYVNGIDIIRADTTVHELTGTELVAMEARS
jgi:hypothetical protein